MTISTHGGRGAEAIESYFRDTASNADPYPDFRRLRDAEPVYWSVPLGYWIVTGYEEGLALYRHPAMSRHAASAHQFAWLLADDDPQEWTQAIRTWTANLLNMDDPDHRRLRRLLQPAFSVKSVARWQPRTEQIVRDVLASAARDDEFDFLGNIAYPIPEQVICEIFGVPHSDHDLWKTWSGAVMQALTLTTRGTDEAGELRSQAGAAIMNWCTYFRDILNSRRGSEGDDLVSVLARVEEHGDQLTEEELIGTCVLTIGAGHETTANLLANGMLCLLREPEQYERLRADPSLASAVVEEALRFDSPSRSQSRVALEDIEIAGKTIREGDTVMITANACNRDPRRYEDVERFDLSREDKDHIAFASGIHYCLGAALARMEATTTFRQLAEADWRLELMEWPLTYRNAHGRALVRLPVRRIP